MLVFYMELPHIIPIRLQYIASNYIIILIYQYIYRNLTFNSDNDEKCTWFDAHTIIFILLLYGVFGKY